MKAELEAKVERQQKQLRDAVVSRETTIRELKCALEEQIARMRSDTAEARSEDHDQLWAPLAADLKRRLGNSEARCEQRAATLLSRSVASARRPKNLIRT